MTREANGFNATASVDVCVGRARSAGPANRVSPKITWMTLVTFSVSSSGCDLLHDNLSSVAGAQIRKHTNASHAVSLKS